jgi:hypothetical protein
MTLGRHWLVALVFVGGTLAILPGLPAQEKKPDKKPADEPAEMDPVIELSTTAYKTADFGRENRSPEALVAAGVMLRSLKGAKKTAIAEQPTDEDGKPLEGKALEDKSFGDEAEDLFAEASLTAAELKLARFDAYIDSAKQRNTRGVVGGARSIRRRLGAGQAHHYHFKFECARPCAIGFHASKPLHLTVCREDIDHVWVNGVYQHETQCGVPGGRRGQTAAVGFRIFNPHRHAVEYHLCLK